MTHRKHWYEIRAWADGWEIETQDAAGIWFSASAPSFYEKSKYRIVPNSEGWLPIYPQPIDIPDGHKLENKTIDGILCYRIIKEDPYAELKAAAKDPTKQIRFLSGSCKDWIDSNKDGTQWNFSFPPENYEIRDKLKPTKKVKLLAWITDSGTFFRAIDGTYVSSFWKRVPSEDKEIEVEL